MAENNKELIKKMQQTEDVSVTFKKQSAALAKKFSTRLATLAGEKAVLDENGYTDTGKKLLSGLMYAALKVPQLQNCKMETIGNCLLQSAVTGLFPGAMDECYYLPFGQDATFVPDYRGLVKLAYQSEFVKDVNYGAVFPDDEFEYQQGTDPFIRHVSHTDNEIPENLQYAYCVVRLVTGGIVFSVMTKKQIDGVKNQSRSGKSEYSPWNKHYISMALKTVIKRALKTIPKNAKMQKALAIDNVSEREDVSVSEIIDAEILEETENGI